MGIKGGCGIGGGCFGLPWWFQQNLYCLNSTYINNRSSNLIWWGLLSLQLATCHAPNLNTRTFVKDYETTDALFPLSNSKSYHGWIYISEMLQSSWVRISANKSLLRFQAKNLARIFKSERLERFASLRVGAFVKQPPSDNGLVS